MFKRWFEMYKMYINIFYTALRRKIISWSFSITTQSLNFKSTFAIINFNGLLFDVKGKDSIHLHCLLSAVEICYSNSFNICFPNWLQAIFFIFSWFRWKMIRWYPANKLRDDLLVNSYVIQTKNVCTFSWVTFTQSYMNKNSVDFFI